MTKPIPLLVEYFATSDLPVVVEEFTPGPGWRRGGFKKHVSCSWLRKLRRQGVTVVALQHGARAADFTVESLLLSVRRGTTT